MRFIVALLISSLACVFAQSLGGSIGCSTVWDCLAASAKGQASASLGCSGGTCQGCNTAAGFDSESGYCGCARVFERNGKPRLSWNSNPVTCLAVNACEVGHDYECNTATAHDTGYCASGGTCACYPGFTDSCTSGNRKRQTTGCDNVNCGCSLNFTSWQNGWPYCLSFGACFADYECGEQAVCSGATVGTVSTAVAGTCSCPPGAWSWSNSPSWMGCSCPNWFPNGAPRVDWTTMTCLNATACVTGQDWQCKNVGGHHETGMCSNGVCVCKTGYSNNSTSGYINCV